MDMFKKEAQKVAPVSPSSSNSSETIIGPSVQVEGNLVSQGNIIVRGTVNGSITTQSDVHLEKGGKILADIQAKNAIVWGEVKGNITINERLEIKSTGQIQGDILTNTLKIEEGGEVEGHFKTGGVKELKMPEPKKEATKDDE